MWSVTQRIFSKLSLLMHNHINIFSNYRNYSPFTLSSLFFFLCWGKLFLSTYFSVSLWKRISGNQKSTFHMHIHTHVCYAHKYHSISGSSAPVGWNTVCVRWEPLFPPHLSLPSGSRRSLQFTTSDTDPLLGSNMYLQARKLLRKHCRLLCQVLSYGRGVSETI